MTTRLAVDKVPGLRFEHAYVHAAKLPYQDQKSGRWVLAVVCKAVKLVQRLGVEFS